MAMNWRGEQQRPCPQCGSANVRWRERGRMDVVRTWARFLLELPFRALLHLLGGAGRGTAGWSAEELHWSGRSSGGGGTQVDYRRMAAEASVRYEAGLSTETADRFWRCGDCGRKGKEYDRLAEIIGMAPPREEAEPPERRW